MFGIEQAANRKYGRHIDVDWKRGRGGDGGESLSGNVGSSRGGSGTIFGFQFSQKCSTLS